MTLVPPAILYSSGGMVSSPDHLASQAGIEMLAKGGSAADAAVAASATLAVTSQHMCGMGGDLWAVVTDAAKERPAALVAAGRAGSGADPDRLRSKGLSAIPPTGDVAAVPVPGCVDGWVALNQRYGRLDLAECLAPAIRHATGGFPASHSLAAAMSGVSGLLARSDYQPARPVAPGTLLYRPRVARALRAIAEGGRDAFYCGPFGEGLIELGAGEYDREDLGLSQASWEDPIAVQAWGWTIWGAPAPSQSYCLLSAAWMASQLGLPDDPDSPLWAHLLVEAIVQSCHDRQEVLSDLADAQALCSAPPLAGRLASISHQHASLTAMPASEGDTVACVVVGPHGDAVSMLQSNASGFGSGLVEERTGIFLHNRGIGFSLQEGHPALYSPRRRPPSTLSPTLAIQDGGGDLLSLATMGGDTQPQVLLQLLTRVLRNGQSPAEAVSAPRWAVVSQPGMRPAGFSTWEPDVAPQLGLEANAPAVWAKGLASMGHRIVLAEPFSFGHAQMIRSHDGVCEGLADPRSGYGGAAGR